MGSSSGMGRSSVGTGMIETHHPIGDTGVVGQTGTVVGAANGHTLIGDCADALGDTDAAFGIEATAELAAITFEVGFDHRSFPFVVSMNT